MAWRIDESVVRGEIDNRMKGVVRGRLWLEGVEEPVTLQLSGNAHRDLAASRKVRVFDVPLEQALEMIDRGEKPPEHLANCLYLEWFSEANGRVVIESTDYEPQGTRTRTR